MHTMLSSIYSWHGNTAGYRGYVLLVGMREPYLARSSPARWMMEYASSPRTSHAGVSLTQSGCKVLCYTSNFFNRNNCVGRSRYFGQNWWIVFLPFASKRSDYMLFTIHDVHANSWILLMSLIK